MSAFDRAVAAFEAIHAEDPEGRAPRYHAALAHFVERLAPDASPALRLAARCQHLGREKLPRSDFPEGPLGYKRWRAAAALAHAERAGEILAAAGCDASLGARVRDLLIKKGLRSDPEVQLFEDAICLTFLDQDFARFAAKHPRDKVIDVVRKTWAKMTPRGHAAALALAADLPEGLRGIVEAAVADGGTGTSA